MRIYAMTATFGKLEHARLELQPGVNIVQAPNEWGKSTWCAFLLAMLYGLDTRAKSTKTTLADKERYAPWSRSPMAGRIDLCWNGRDITIERSTKGRVPLGVFRAYETDTGLEVPELTAANCGTMLLGVEQSVFRRAGFIRQSDMPVTQDEALRRRLNDLVTTGDESGDGDRLAQELKELKNKCRYNRTGLLPQAETERKVLEEKIGEWDSLQIHSRNLKQRLAEAKQFLTELENHKSALDYAAAEADAARVAQARDHRDNAERRLAAADAACAALPTEEEATEKIRQLQQLQNQWQDLLAALAQLPEPARLPEPPFPFLEGTGKPAEAVLEGDIRRYAQLKKEKIWLLLLAAAAAFGLGAAAFAAGSWWAAMGGCLAAVPVLLVLGFRRRKLQLREIAALEEEYGDPHPENWKMRMEDYGRLLEQYRSIQLEQRGLETHLQARQELLEQQQAVLCGSQSLESALDSWQKVLQQRESHRQALREFQQADRYLQALKTMAKPAKQPAQEDVLSCSMEETFRLMAETRAEQQRLQNRLGQYQGRMDALGNRDGLLEQLEQLQHRIGKLEQIYQAVTLGLETLTKARQELQRRFAPRISKRAQELLEHMTAGRYDRLSLSEEMCLLSAAQQEDTLHEALWRSDGTVDQLYFALRLAVAEELTPQAPLVLDDAFVRFDDTRLKAALEILREAGEKKQVILFTCQSREKALMQ